MNLNVSNVSNEANNSNATHQTKSRVKSKHAKNKFEQNELFDRFFAPDVNITLKQINLEWNLKYIYNYISYNFLSKMFNKALIDPELPARKYNKHLSVYLIDHINKRIYIELIFSDINELDSKVVDILQKKIADIPNENKFINDKIMNALNTNQQYRNFLSFMTSYNVSKAEYKIRGYINATNGNFVVKDKDDRYCKFEYGLSS